MYQKQFQSVVHTFNGKITKVFEQNISTSFGVLNFDKATSNGACDALSTYWILSGKQGTNFWSWALKPSSILKLRDYMAKYSGSTFDNNIEKAGAVLKPAGMSIKSEGTTGFKPWDPQKVSIELIGSNGYKKIGFDGRGGGHAIAVYISDGDCRFFDPNYGEASFKSKMNFAYFFTKFWNSNYFYRTKLGESGDVVLWR
jgi:hypothetical protein